MPSNKPIRVIIDTNLWVSFLIGKQLSSLQPLLETGIVQPILAQQLLTEITLVTQRPKLRKYFPPEKVEALITLLTNIGQVIEIYSEVSVCRDPKDNYLLALAQDSQADYLLTGDQDLLIIETFGITKILTYQAFIQQENL
jgi:uncharacterized protein